MRTLRSLGTTISSTPLFLSFCPICQRRPSSTPSCSIEVPCSDLSVTTTSWSVVLASRSASFWVSAARVAGSRISAWSTTRPVSGGNSTARAGRMSVSNTQDSASRPTRGRRSSRKALTSSSPSELHLRRTLRLFRDGEGLHRLIPSVERRSPDQARERAQLRIVLPHRLDVVAARHRDAVLGALELRLQRQKILVRLQLRIALRYRQQPAERAGELRLRLLEALKRFRVGDDVGRDLHLGRARPRIGHRFQHLALLGGIALHGLDQIGDQIGAALVLVEHLRPSCLGGFLVARDVVDATACEQAETCGEDGEAGEARHGGAHDFSPARMILFLATGVLPPPARAPPQR